jgi:hypothetical protein
VEYVIISMVKGKSSALDMVMTGKAHFATVEYGMDGDRRFWR